MTLGDVLNELAKDSTKMFKWSYEHTDALPIIGINESGRLSRVVNGMFDDGRVTELPFGAMPITIERIKKGIFEEVIGVSNSDYFARREINDI